MKPKESWFYNLPNFTETQNLLSPLLDLEREICGEGEEKINKKYKKNELGRGKEYSIQE